MLGKLAPQHGARVTEGPEVVQVSTSTRCAPRVSEAFVSSAIRLMVQSNYSY